MSHRRARKVRKEIRKAITDSDMREYLENLEMELSKGKHLLDLLLQRNSELEQAMAKQSQAGPVEQPTISMPNSSDVPDMLETT